MLTFNKKAKIQIRIFKFNFFSGCASIMVAVDKSDEQLKAQPLFTQSMLNDQKYLNVSNMAQTIVELEKQYGNSFESTIEQALQEPEVVCKDPKITKLKQKLDEEIKDEMKRHFFHKRVYLKSDSVELKEGQSPDQIIIPKNVIYHSDWNTKLIKATCNKNKLDVMQPIEFSVQFKTEYLGVIKFSNILKTIKDHQIEIINHRSLYRIEQPKQCRKITFITSPTKVI